MRINLYVTKTNTRDPSGIETHDPNNQVAKTYALDSTATGISYRNIYWNTYKYNKYFFRNTAKYISWGLIMYNQV
jgi:hypothetical protein